jgi:hypothetical protein
VDVGDADVEEAADPVGVAGRLERHRRLVVGWPSAGVDDDPAVGERDDRRLAVFQYLPAEHAGVEAARPVDVGGDDEVREGDSLRGCRERGHG